MKRISSKQTKCKDNIGIPDGFSNYSPKKESYYEKLKSLSVNVNLFKKYKPNSRYNPYGVELTKAEIDFIKRLEAIGESIELISPKRSRKSCNDFVWRGKEWELKTFVGKSGFTLANAIWRATDQHKQNIMLDTTFNSHMTFNKIILYVLGHLKKNGNRKIKNLIVVRGKKFVIIKQRESHCLLP